MCCFDDKDQTFNIGYLDTIAWFEWYLRAGAPPLTVDDDSAFTLFFIPVFNCAFTFSDGFGADQWSVASRSDESDQNGRNQQPPDDEDGQYDRR